MKEVRVMKSRLVFIALSFSILLGLYSFSSGKYSPSIPKALFRESVLNNYACTIRHTPGTQTPRQKTHTVKLECMACHKEVTAKFI